MFPAESCALDAAQHHFLLENNTYGQKTMWCLPFSNQAHAGCMAQVETGEHLKVIPVADLHFLLALGQLGPPE